MSDDVDRANALAEAERQHQIAKHAAAQANNMSECEDCGEPIGAARKAALPSATRCVFCQEIFEVEN